MIGRIKDYIANIVSSQQYRLYLIIAAVIVVVYMSLAIGAAATKSPWCDEAWFASPAFNLSAKGFMGTTVLESSGTWLEGIDKYTYWIPPGYILAQAGWFEIFGFSLVSMRALSAAFGLLALFSWFLFLKNITGENKTAFLAFAIIALDYCFIMTASVGRMDMMSAALNIAAFAAYMQIRKQSVTGAILIGHTLAAVSVFTHPTGVLAFAGLLFLTLHFDWKEIKFWRLAIGAVPYLIGAGLWGLYIAESPSLFLSQFGGNVNGIHQTDRLAVFTSPIMTLKDEIITRYLGFYGLGSESSGAARFKIFILLSYLAGIIAAVLTSGIRRHRGHRGLLFLTALYFVMLLL